MYGDNAIISIMNQVSFFVRSMIWKRKAIFTSLLGVVEPKWFFFLNQITFKKTPEQSDIRLTALH